MQDQKATKKCRICKIEKVLSEFWKKKDRLDGRCRTCEKEMRKHYERTEKDVQCRQCKVIQPAKEYHTDSRKRLGVETKCRTCKKQRSEMIAKKRIESKELKHCKTCKKQKPLADFSINVASKDGLQSNCNNCYKAKYSREPVKDEMVECNKCGIPKPPADFVIARTSTTGLTKDCKLCLSQENSKWTKLREDIKQGQKCSECGYNTDERALCFVPMDKNNAEIKKRKYHSISHIVRSKKTVSILKDCKILCRNCARIFNIKPTKDIRKQMQCVNQSKLKRQECIDCKMKVTKENSFIFDFDHKDASVKAASIAFMATSKRYTIEQILHEIEKCDLRCACCHYIIGIQRGQMPFQTRRYFKPKRKEIVTRTTPVETNQTVTLQ